MKIGVFERSWRQHRSEATAFERKLGSLAEFEMRGLGIEGTKMKPTTSNRFSLYFLANGVQICKYGHRYAIIVENDELLHETAELLEIAMKDLTVTDSVL